MKIVLVAFCFSLLYAGCGLFDRCLNDKRLQFHNNTNRAITWTMNLSLPDSSINVYDRPYVGERSPIVVGPYEKEYIRLNGECWESLYESRVPSGKIEFMFVDVDTIRKYGWELTWNSKNVLRRDILSLDDLRAKNWHLNYP